MTPLTTAHQVPLSMELSRQECWSRLPFLRIKSGSPALQAVSLPSGPPGKHGSNVTPLAISPCCVLALRGETVLLLFFLTAMWHGLAGVMWPQAWIVLVLSRHYPVWKMLRHWFWKEDELQMGQSQPPWTIQTSPSIAAGGWMKILSATASHKLHFAAVYNKS